MRKVAFLVAASPNDAFYSQIAALWSQLRQIPWLRWEPIVHVFLAGDREADPIDGWRPHLDGVELHWTDDALYGRDGDWAQSDEVFRTPVPGADIIIALDADTFPMRPLDTLLDRVWHTGAVAGVVAHFPPVRAARSEGQPNATSNREAWQAIARGLVSRPLDFAFTHTLLPHDDPDRATPFYLNFGVVAFRREVFERIAPRYLELRPRVAARLPTDDFSGQVALTLAVTDTGARTWALPLRYNFPNDALAEAMYPVERDNAAIVHYLRTSLYDRHLIFASAGEYARFTALPLHGIDRTFRDAVVNALGPDYPFPRTVPLTRATYSP